MQATASSEPPKSRSILLVTEPGMDGVFHYVKNLTHHLLNTGWRVHLAYSSRRSCPALFELISRVESAGGQTQDLQVGNAPTPGDARALWRLWSLARAVRPEVIHAHSSKAGALARALPLLGVKARLVYTPHAYYKVHQPMTAGKRFFTTIERLLGRIGHTIATSASEADYARTAIGIPPDRLCISVTGVDCQRFHPPGDGGEKRAARALFGLPPEALLLGTVARYSAQKDTLTLYRAVLECLARHPTLWFAHLGKGELKGAADQLIAGAPADVRARIHRVETSNDTPSFYRALDAFTLPSSFEGFALSALEAMATGLPMILSDCPGNDDLKHYGLNAMWWSVPRNSESLAREIDAWASAPPPSNNHRMTAQKQFDLTTAATQMVGCYDDAPCPG